jgi:chromosome segregation ATPase
MARAEEIKEIKERLAKEKRAEKLRLKREKMDELKEKYGVIKGIPEQVVEEKVEVEKKPKEEVKIPDIALKVERIGARIDAMEDYRKTLDEKISRFSEEIGELRSTFLALDKRFTSLEVSAEKAVKAVEEIKPEEIKKDFEKRDRKLLELTAQIERMNEMLNSLKKEGAELRGMLEKIKSVENILEVSRKIEEKISRIEEVSRYADRTAAKVEVVFSELSGKLGEIERHKGKIERLDELTREMVKMLDEISLKLPKFAEKVEVEKAKEEITKNIKVRPAELPRIEEKLKIVEEMKKSLEEAEHKIRFFEEKMDEFKKSIEGIKEIKLPEIKTFEEKIAILSKEIEGLKKVKPEELEKISNEITNIKITLEENLRRFESFENRLAGFEELKTRPEVSSGEIKVLNQKIENLKSEYEKRFEELTKLVESISGIEKMISEIQSSIKGVEEKRAPIEEKIKKISNVTKNLMGIIEKESTRMEKIQKSTNTYFEFLIKVNNLQNLVNLDEVKNSFNIIRKKVEEMKEIGIFDETIREFLRNTLLSLSQTWKSYGNEELAKVYMDEANFYLPKEREKPI